MTLTDTPLVSVVLVTYNSARYVIETLESIKKQTWKNIELIVSDDASPDNTVQLCSDWLYKNRDRFVSTKLITVAQNTGIPSNCNRGVRSAKGEWIKMIGGDDILLENAVADNLVYAAQHPAISIIISDVQEIDEDNVLIRDKVANEALVFFTGLSSTKKQLKGYCRWPAFLNSPTFFYKKEVFEKINYFDEEFRIFEDMTSLIRVLEKDIKLGYMKTTTVAYRIHKNGISRNPRMNESLKKETIQAFQVYRKPHLNPLNPFDLSIYYESWLGLKYKGFNGVKGDSLLRKLSLYYWYMKAKGIKSY